MIVGALALVMGGRARPVAPLRRPRLTCTRFEIRRVCRVDTPGAERRRRPAPAARDSSSRSDWHAPCSVGRNHEHTPVASAAPSAEREARLIGRTKALGPAGQRLAERLAYRPREVVVVALLAAGLVRWARGRAVASPPPGWPRNVWRRSRPGRRPRRRRARGRGPALAASPPAARSPGRRGAEPARGREQGPRPPRLDLNRATPGELARVGRDQLAARGADRRGTRGLRGTGWADRSRPSTSARSATPRAEPSRRSRTGDRRPQRRRRVAVSAPLLPLAARVCPGRRRSASGSRDPSWLAPAGLAGAGSARGRARPLPWPARSAGVVVLCVLAGWARVALPDPFPAVRGLVPGPRRARGARRRRPGGRGAADAIPSRSPRDRRRARATGVGHAPAVALRARAHPSRRAITSASPARCARCEPFRNPGRRAARRRAAHPALLRDRARGGGGAPAARGLCPGGSGPGSGSMPSSRPTCRPSRARSSRVSSSASAASSRRPCWRTSVARASITSWPSPASTSRWSRARRFSCSGSRAFPTPLAAGLALATLVAFAAVVGGQPSVLRATVMGGLFLAAGLLGRESRVWNSLAAALLVLLALDPGSLVEPGLQLSFAATAGLLHLGPWIRARLAPWCPGPIASALAVSAGAQLGVTPVMLLHFGQLSPLGVVANLLVVPLAGLAHDRRRADPGGGRP